MPPSIPGSAMTDAATPDPDALGLAGHGWPQASLRRLSAHRPAVAALLSLSIIALVVTLGPLLLPYAYDEQDYQLIGQPGEMTSAHWLGTDQLGRDALTRLIHGGPIPPAVGLSSPLIATLLGTLVGASSGFFRGIAEIRRLCSPAA